MVSEDNRVDPTDQRITSDGPVVKRKVTGDVSRDPAENLHALRLREMYERFGSAVRRRVLSKVPIHEADDVFADVWSHVSASIVGLRDEAKARAWLYAVADKRIATYMAKRYREHRADAPELARVKTISSRLRSRELRERVLAIVPPLLPEAARNIFELYFQQRLELDAIQRELRARGVQTATGNEFDRATIRNAIKKWVYPHIKRIASLEGLAPVALARVVRQENSSSE